MRNFDDDFKIEKESASVDDSIKNKERIYGRYEDQRIAVGKCINALDELAKTVRVGDVGLSEEERFDYTVMLLKITRSVTARDSVDSYLDLANYTRLICRARTGVDILDELCKIKDEKCALANDARS